MQKIVKYVIAIGIVIFFFGAGFISGCAYSNRASRKMEQENTELREKISNYSNELELSKRQRESLARRISDFESEIVGLETELSGIIEYSSNIESRYRALHRERSNIGQGIQEVRDGLAELDSEIRSFIEGAENP